MHGREGAPVNIPFPTRAEPAPLVTIEDTNEPECEGCDHVTAYHGMSGCHFNTCGCMRTHRDVISQHIERIVRREMAKELDRIAQDMDERVDWSDGRNNYGDNEAYEAAARTLRARAEEVRNG